MRIDEYDNLKRQVEEKYKKAIQAAEKERSERLSAIETVWNLVKAEQVVSQNSNGDDKDYGSLTVDVKNTLSFLPEIFTKNDIIRVLPYEPNENSLSGCLFRLQKQGIISVYEKGQGRAPSKYSKVPVNTKITEEALKNE